MKPTNYWRTLVICLGALLAVCVLPLRTTGQQDNQATIRFVRNPDPAPDFKLAGLDGKPVTLADSKGKVILLNFWATWCGPCRAEVPDLVELQNKYKDKLQVIGLVTDDDDDPDAVQKFVKEFEINYPIAFATSDLRIQYGGIPALPTSFMLDTEGRIVQKHEGLRNPALYEAEIRSLAGLPLDGVRVETFEDKGEILLKHADRASQLPGVDMSKLTPEQKTVALHRFNAESCTCGCGYTLAQCRIWDRNCPVSKAATSKIIAEIISGKEKPGTSAKPAPAEPAATPAAPATSAPTQNSPK
jgi:cytochrome c biogenesis protein CcmG/thiol:disulfide interchange protein DsbE